MPKQKSLTLSEKFDLLAVQIFSPGPRGMSSNKRNRSMESDNSGDKPSKKADKKATPSKEEKKAMDESRGSGDPPGESGGPSGAQDGAQALDKAMIDALPSYAEKAGEGVKKKPSFPWALYIFGGISGDLPITGKHFWAFQKFVQDKWFTLPSEERKWIEIEYWDYNDTVGVCFALNRYTAMWIKQLAKVFTFEDIPTKGFNRWERVESWLFKSFLRGPNWKALKGSHVLKTALKEVGLEGYNFTNLTWDKRNPAGVFMSFEASPRLAEALDNTPYLLYGGVCIRLKKRARKSISEKQWFEQLGYEQAMIGDNMELLESSSDEEES